ncbi:MAG: cupredoxin domain-containing protein [Acidimicrobiia bacterium]
MDSRTTGETPIRTPDVATHVGGVGSSGPSPAGPGFRPIWLVIATLLFVGGAAAVIVIATRSGTHEPRVYEYTVPNGTGARIEAGEKLYVFPAKLEVHVGDQILIHNEDVRPAVVGPYTVDRNSTLSQTFASPGYITGFCSIHPSGRVTIHIVS